MELVAKVVFFGRLSLHIHEWNSIRSVDARLRARSISSMGHVIDFVGFSTESVGFQTKFRLWVHALMVVGSSLRALRLR